MNPPSSPHKQPNTALQIIGDTKQIKKIFFWFAITVIFGLLSGILIVLSENDYYDATVMSIVLLPLLLTLLLIRRNNFELAASFMAVALMTLVTMIATDGIGIHHLSVLGMPAILIIASLVIRRRTMIFLTLFAVGCVAWLVFGEIYGLFKVGKLYQSVPGDFFTAALTLVLTAFMVSLLAESLFQSNRQLQSELHEKMLAEQRLAFDALHDSLTSLPNRTLFMDRLGQKLEYVRRHPENLFAILYLDLDRFKVINDSLGHAIGDQVLIATASRLLACVRTADTVSRLSGDEFAILLDDIRDTSDAIRLAYRIQETLTSTSMLQDVNRVSTASIGIAIYDKNYTQPEEMLRDADTAMYRAKAQGGGHYQVFDATMYARAVALLKMEAELKQAVERQEWQVYYQPILSMKNQLVHGVEALVRWQPPRHALVEPAEFIGVAEETGLIMPMGEYVLRTACQQVVSLRLQGYPALWVSVNISARQFQDLDLPKTIRLILDQIGLPSDGLKLELTESVAMKDVSYSLKVMQQLEAMGVLISLDDFGIGHSSLEYLNRFPIKVLKIDRAFLKAMDGNRNNEAIVQAIISMGHALHLDVIAEGVETRKQLEFLNTVHCDYAQGYLFSRPVAQENLLACLGEWKGSS